MLARLGRWLRREEAGFTLIELMIVVLVILVLAAILIPQFGLARERARKASCVSNQRNIETAVSMWAADHPTTSYAGGTMQSGGSTPNITDLTGSTTGYTTVTNFVEPDDPGATGSDGTDYYLSNGAPGNPSPDTSAVGTNPSYGHVACAYDGVADPWVAGYDAGLGSGTGISHTRGVSASP